MKMGWKLVGDRLMECVTVSDQTNRQHLEMYKEGAGKVDRVVMCLWMEDEMKLGVKSQMFSARVECSYKPRIQCRVMLNGQPPATDPAPCLIIIPYSLQPEKN